MSLSPLNIMSDETLALKANARAGLPTPTMHGWTEISWSNEGIEYWRRGDRLFLPPSAEGGEWQELLSLRQLIPPSEEGGEWRELLSSPLRRPHTARKASIRSLVARPPDGLQDDPLKAAGEPGLLVIGQAAAYLGITDDQVAAFVQDGELSYINVGRGKKRARYRFTIPDLQAFIEHRRRREVFCQSTSPKSRRTTTSTARSEVIGFMAARAAQLGKKPKPSKR